MNSLQEYSELVQNELMTGYYPGVIPNHIPRQAPPPQYQPLETTPPLSVPEKRYHCNECGKSFGRSDILNVHKRIHTGERPYACGFCVKAFYTKNDLNRHERTHTGESPYACDQCDRAFKERACLRKHQRIHTGEKPYQCELCQRWFARKHYLTGHMKNKHAEDRTYSCEVCGINLTTNVTIENHKLGTEKTYSCDQRKFICDRYYEIQNDELSNVDMYEKLRESFCSKFPDKKAPPGNKTIYNIVKRYEDKFGMDNLPPNATSMQDRMANKVRKKSSVPRRKVTKASSTEEMDPSVIIEQYKILCEETFGKGIKQEIPDVASLGNDPALIMKHYQRLCEETIAESIKQEIPDCIEDNTESVLDCGPEMKVKHEVKYEDCQENVLPDSKINGNENILQDALRVEFKEEAPDKEFGDFLKKISNIDQNCVDPGTNLSSKSEIQTPPVDDQENKGELKYSSKLENETEQFQSYISELEASSAFMQNSNQNMFQNQQQQIYHQEFDQT